MALPKGTPRPCKGCGTTIFKLKFCTNDCRVNWYARTCAERSRERDRAKGVRSWVERYSTAYRANTVERTCQHCASSFTRRKRAKDAALFCSKRCAGAARTKARNKAEAIAAFIRRERAVYRAWAKRNRPAPVVGKACRDCGAEVRKGAQRCEPCREKAAHRNKKIMRLRQKENPSYRAAKARSKALRRQRRKDARTERFDPFEVFERDKWRCHICGIRTPKRLRGTYEDSAPELDHVIPLAAGGEHSRRNTACACRKCNIEKGDKPLGQLRLVA